MSVSHLPSLDDGKSSLEARTKTQLAANWWKKRIIYTGIVIAWCVDHIINSALTRFDCASCCYCCIVNQKPYGLFAVCYGKINKELSRRKSYTTIPININQSANTVDARLISASASMVNRNIHVRYTNEFHFLFALGKQSLFIRNNFDNRQ